MRRLVCAFVVRKTPKTIFFASMPNQIFQLTNHHKLVNRSNPLVTCLATDVSMTADPGVTSSIPARSHTFVEIDYEIISMVIFLASAESFKKDCCQLQVKVCARSTV